MTNNQVSQIISLRIDRRALGVLQWHAMMTGVPLRTFIRQYLEQTAVEVTEQYGLDPDRLDLAQRPPDLPPTDLDPPDDETLEPLPAAPPGPRLDEFTAKLAVATGRPAADLAATATADADGTIYVVVNGVEFTDTPTEPLEVHA
jgi:hypothetical protein